MSRCYALTDKGRPCRNYAEVLERTPTEILYSPTCKHHRGEEGRSIFKNKLEFNMMYYNHTKRLLRDGIVEINKEIVSSITQRLRRNYTHFILLCAKYVQGFQRDWNSILFDKAIKNIWAQTRLIGPIDVTWDDLIVLGSCYGDSMEGFLSLLTQFPEERRDEPSRDEWHNFVYKVLESEWGKSILLHPLCLDSMYWDRLKEYSKVRYMSNLVPLIQSGLLYSMVKTERESIYTKAKERCSVYKDELLEIAWDVDRVVDWCMPSDEQKGMKDRWGKN